MKVCPNRTNLRLSKAGVRPGTAMDGIDSLLASEIADPDRLGNSTSSVPDLILNGEFPADSNWQMTALVLAKAFATISLSETFR